MRLHLSLTRLLFSTLVGILTVVVSAPGLSVPKLSKKERAERIRQLPEEERHWLEEVARPIILSEEENLFLLLTQAHERAIFKEEFWKRRERDGLGFPLGPGYRIRYQELLRLADTTYDGRREDAGKMVIAHGEPAAIDELEGCKDMFRDLQIWTYRGTTAGNRGDLRYFFYRRSPGAPRKLWDVTVSDSEVFQPGSCRKHFADLSIECTSARTPQTDPCYYVTNCQQVCWVLRSYLEIKARQGTALGGTTESASVLAPPAVDLEGLGTLAARFPSVLNPQARPISVEGGSARNEQRPPTLTPSPRASLTPDEIRDLILRLEPQYREFLDLAGPLLVGDELSRFLQMPDPGKDAFIREFWRRHR